MAKLVCYETCGQGPFRGLHGMPCSFECTAEVIRNCWLVETGPMLRRDPRRAHAASMQRRPPVRRGGLQRSCLGRRHDQSGEYSTEYTQQLFLLTRKKHNARGHYPRAFPCQKAPAHF